MSASQTEPAKDALRNPPFTLKNINDLIPVDWEHAEVVIANSVGDLYSVQSISMIREVNGRRIIVVSPHKHTIDGK